MSTSSRPARQASQVQRTALALLTLMLLALIPAASAGATPALQAGALPGSFAPGPCPIADVPGVQLDCGYLTVAESRSSGSARTIRLAVAILRSPNPAPDPVVFLAGGPGQAAVDLAPALAQFYAPVLAHRDIILIDQRGTGYSQPALDCRFSMRMLKDRFPIGKMQQSDIPEVIQFQRDQLIGCLQVYQQLGVDLSAYNTVENAADLEDLRRALGYDQWNVIGGSYGTRLALTAMQYRPETIRSVVLDSVYPLQANFHTGVFASFNQSLSRLFAGCAAEAACNAAYPHLDQQWDTMLEQLNANPAQVPLIDPTTGKVIDYIPVTGNDVSALTFQLMYITQVIPIMPTFIAETASGNYELLGVLLGALLLAPAGNALPVSLGVQQETAAPVSIGMQTAVQCNEDATFAQLIDFVAARDSNRRTAALAYSIVFNEAYLDVCNAVGLNHPNPVENQPVSSDLPTLIFSGEYDPITPDYYARSAAETLSRSTFVSYPRGGHSPTGASLCLNTIMAAFVNDPGAALDTSCVAQEAPAPFLVP